MPQAVLGIASDLPDPSMGLAVAATYVAGFRASLAQHPLVAEVPWGDAPGNGTSNDVDVERAIEDAIGDGPTAAAAAVWAVPDADFAGVLTALATRAAVHRDAHLVKYTLACFDAASDDPAHARLFLTAAGSLAGWWATIGAADGA
jgi:hypothetical protein